MYGDQQQPGGPMPGGQEQVPPAPGPTGPVPPAPPRGKRRALVTTLVVVVVIAALCGAGQLITNLVNQDDWEGLGEPVAASARVTPKPTWRPPNELTNPQPVQQIRHQLETWVLASAGVAKPMTSACDPAEYIGRQATTLTCTVTYDGNDVVFEVLTRPKGRSLIEWEATAKETVVTREGLLALVHSRFGEGSRPPGCENCPTWENLRCEEFPAVALVPVGKPLGQVCYAKEKDAIKTSRIRIKPSAKGEPQLDTEHQE